MDVLYFDGAQSPVGLIKAPKPYKPLNPKPYSTYQGT